MIIVVMMLRHTGHLDPDLVLRRAHIRQLLHEGDHRPDIFIGVSQPPSRHGCAARIRSID